MIDRLLVRADRVAVGVLLAVTLVGVGLWPVLPSEMAIHFDAGSTPDRFVAKSIGVVAAPAIGVAAIALVRVTTRLDDGRRPDAAVATLTLGGLVAYVQLLVLAWNVGVRFDVTLAAVVPIVVVAGLLALPAVRRWRHRSA